MLSANISSILILSDRQRKEFDPASIAELAEDIRVNGLYHPPLVRLQDDSTMVLVAGERRMRALAQLIMLGDTFLCDGTAFTGGMIPVIRLSKTDILSATEAELHENILREPLTWQERTLAESRLVELRAAQAQKEGLPPPRMADVAVSAGMAAGSGNILSESVEISKHLDDPEVQRASSKKEAKKIVERKRQEEYAVVMAKALRATPSESRHRLLEGDFRTVTESIPNGSLDGIITDPPYFRNLHAGGEQGNSAFRDFDDSSSRLEKTMTAFAIAANDKCKPDAHLYLFCSFENFAEIAKIITDYGHFKVWSRPLIWYKGNAGVAPVPDRGPRYTYECILYAYRGEKKTRVLSHDVIPLPGLAKTLHPDEKPVSLYVDLLERSAIAGESWADFFAGSGTLFPAANRLHLRATCIEMNPTYAAIALNRRDKET